MAKFGEAGAGLCNLSILNHLSRRTRPYKNLSGSALAVAVHTFDLHSATVR
jgi:hypothetical protein